MPFAIVKHRINDLSDLDKLAPGLGAEIDLRSARGTIHLHHDPFQNGPLLVDFLKAWGSRARGTLILNPKEDGLEQQALDALAQHSISDFFFLDLTIPTTVRLIRRGEKRVAIRYSEFEPLEMVKRFCGKLEWVWIDCFDGAPPAENILNLLRKDFRTCLVSPELQGYPTATIEQFIHLRPMADAVCTKFPELWAR